MPCTEHGAGSLAEKRGNAQPKRMFGMYVPGNAAGETGYFSNKERNAALLP